MRIVFLTLGSSVPFDDVDEIVNVFCELSRNFHGCKMTCIRISEKNSNDPLSHFWNLYTSITANKKVLFQFKINFISTFKRNLPYPEIYTRNSSQI